MSESDPVTEGRSPTTSIVFILLTMLAGFYLVGPLIGTVLAIPFIQGSLEEFSIRIANGSFTPDIRLPLYIVQGTATFVGLIAGPLLYWVVSEQKKLTAFRTRPVRSLPLLLTGVAVIAFMAPNSLVHEWNAGVTFPDSLKGFENWTRTMEDRASEIVEFLTAFPSQLDFDIAMIVIAILPAIGEELVFRGMLQPKLKEATGNVHVAIWISACLFSMMHLQFLGFFPRLLLGVGFGYLYEWSGNLIVPVFAHFVNNSFALLLILLFQVGIIQEDPNSAEALPVPMILSGTIVTFGILLYLRKTMKRNLPTA